MNLGREVSNIIKRLYLVSNLKPEFNDPISNVPVNLPKNRYLAIIRSVFPYPTKRETSERIVEYPFVYTNLNVPKKGKIIEIGCSRSRVAIELASLGHKVTACDLKPYEYRHPNLTFIQGDLRLLNLPSNHYDGATAISTIEHTGIGAYGEKLSKRGDKEMVNKIYEILKPKGLFIITVPFGKREINKHERVYNYKDLVSLLKKFKIIKIEFYEGLERKYWIPVPYKRLATVSSVKKGYSQGIACVVGQKR